jgi:hypothetical protein
MKTNEVRHKKRFSVTALAVVVLLGSTMGLAAHAEGTLTITGAIGAGQRNIFSIRKCRSHETYIQDKVSCELLPFTLKINERTSLDEGLYSVNGPHNWDTGSQILGIRVYDGENTTVPLKPVSIPKVNGVRFRMFLDLTNGDEFRKMAIGVWSSEFNRAFIGMSCSLPDSFNQYICGSWQAPTTLYGAMIDVDKAGSYYFIHRNALRNAGAGFRMANLGRVFVNDLVDTGTEVGVFPGVYGIEYVYPDGHIWESLGFVVN